MLKTVKDILTSIADKVDANPRIWTQHTTDDGAGAHCLLGLIYAECIDRDNGYVTDERKVDQTIGALHKTHTINYGYIVSWNDTLGRTPQEVSALCREAADAQ